MVANRLRQGQEALRRGAQLEARRHFLAALALDPGNKVAFETLRDRVKEIHFVAHTVAGGETLASIADRAAGADAAGADAAGAEAGGAGAAGADATGAAGRGAGATGAAGPGG